MLRILTLSYPRIESPGDKGRLLAQIITRSDLSGLDFGHPATKTSYNSYLFQTADESFEVFVPYIWKNLCYAYQRPGFSVAVLVGQSHCISRDTTSKFGAIYPQNGKAMNINFLDESLSELKIPRELAYKVHLMGCNNNFTRDCTAPGGLVTEFNLWDRGLSLQEMKEWTTCRQMSSSSYETW